MATSIYEETMYVVHWSSIRDTGTSLMPCLEALEDEYPIPAEIITK